MALFSKAIDFVLKHEGGYVNNPADPGGETNFGISKRSYPHIDVATLTLNQAKLIYLADYWNKNSLSSIKDQRVATKIMDMIVNLGKTRAIGIIQRLLNLYENHLVVDGVLGHASFEAINKTNADLLLEKIVTALTEFYQHIVDIKPERKVFLKGWLNRAKDLPEKE